MKKIASFNFNINHNILLQNAQWAYDNSEFGAWGIKEDQPYDNELIKKLIHCHEKDILQYHIELYTALHIIRDVLDYEKCKDYISIHDFKLIKNTNFLYYINSYSDSYPYIAINPKRPYGNSNVYDDINDILNLNLNKDSYKEADLNIMKSIHYNTIISWKNIFKYYKFSYGKYNFNSRSIWEIDKIDRRLNIIKDILDSDE